MKNNYIRRCFISRLSYLHICDLFNREYNQDELCACFFADVPPFVRWNCRNVYGVISCSDFSDFFVVSSFYRIARDGSPVKLVVREE